MVFETSTRTDTHCLTCANDEDDHQSNLHRLLKTAKFRLIGLNSSFVKRLNGKILDEFHLNERSFGERMRLKEDHSADDRQVATDIHRNYQTISQTISQTIDAESEHPEETETPIGKKFRLKPKKRLLKFLRRLSLKSVYESMNLNLYEELKPSAKEEEKVKKKKKKKVMKKIRKIMMDVCTNISGGVHLMDTGYSYPDQHYGYDYFGSRPMYINYHGYDYKANDYSYNTTIIYGPRYM